MDSDTAAAPDTTAIVRRYALGLGVLFITVFLSNVFGFLQHPEQVFDVPRNTPLESLLYLIGFAGQLATGCWLGVALIFDLAPGRRFAVLAWLASLALFFAPMPSPRDDAWLTPLLCAGVGGVAWMSRALDRALDRQVG